MSVYKFGGEAKRGTDKVDDIRLELNNLKREIVELKGDADTSTSKIVELENITKRDKLIIVFVKSVPTEKISPSLRNTPALINYPNYIYNLNTNVRTITTKVSVKRALYKIMADVKVLFLVS